MLAVLAFGGTGLTLVPPEGIVENQSQQPLIVFVVSLNIGGLHSSEIGVVNPGESKTCYSSQYVTVAATNLDGELVFLHTVTSDDNIYLEDDDNIGFGCSSVVKGPPDSLVVIPPDTPMHGPTTINMTIQNPSDIDLRVYVNDNAPVDVFAKDSMVVDIPVDFGRYLIRMLDPYGEPAFTTTKLYENLGDLLNDNSIVVAEVPYQELVIQNDTGEKLVVNVNQYIVNDVEQGESVISVPWYTHGDEIIVWAGYSDEDYFFQERFNVAGGREEPWSKQFTYSSFQELMKRGWRITIPPPETR
jgi:hypothetical protein